MKSNEQNKHNRKRLIDTENILTAVRREGVWGLGDKGAGIKKKKTLIDSENSMVNT